MYCAASVSSIAVRTRRTLVAARITASVMTGITRPDGLSAPLGGSQCSAMENTSTSMIASQKLGNERPTREKIRIV